MVRHWGDMLIKYDKWIYYHNIGTMPSFEYYDISSKLWYHPNIVPRKKCYLGTQEVLESGHAPGKLSKVLKDCVSRPGWWLQCSEMAKRRKDSIHRNVRLISYINVKKLIYEMKNIRSLERQHYEKNQDVRMPSREKSKG